MGQVAVKEELEWLAAIIKIHGHLVQIAGDRLRVASQDDLGQWRMEALPGEWIAVRDWLGY